MRVGPKRKEEREVEGHRTKIKVTDKQVFSFQRAGPKIQATANSKNGGSRSRVISGPSEQKGGTAKLALWKKLKRRDLKTVDVVFLMDSFSQSGKNLFVPAHSAVVKKASGVLRQMTEEQERRKLRRRTTEKDQRLFRVPAGVLVVSVPKRRKDVFQMVLKYIYTGLMESALVPAFLTMAQDFGLGEKLKESWKMMKRQEPLTEENATKMFDFAFWQGDKEMLSLALEFIERNASAVLASPDFPKLSKSAMERILLSDRLCVDSEIEVFNALVRWLQVNCKKEKEKLSVENVAQHIGGTTHLVRYTWIPLAEMRTAVLNSGVLAKDHWIQIMKTREDPADNPLGLKLEARKGIH